MLIAKWAVLIIFNLLLKYLIAWPLAPVIVLFAQEDGNLPRSLKWFGTHDNTLDGDRDWKESFRPYLAEDTKFKKWVNRYSWIRRNSLYSFNEDVLSLEFKDTDKLVGDPLIPINRRPGNPGFIKTSLYREGKEIAFMWYLIKPYSSRPDKCMRILLGWKLFQFGKHNASKKIHIAFSPGIWMSYGK